MANDGSVANYRGGPASLWATGPKVEAMGRTDRRHSRPENARIKHGLIQDSTTANQDKAYLQTVDRITYFPENTQRKFTIGYGANPALIGLCTHFLGCYYTHCRCAVMA